MRTALRRMGNSAGMIVPRAIISELGSAIGTEFEIGVEGGRIVASPLQSVVRAGWADAARELSESGDDGPVWPEFGNDEDAALTW